MTFYMSKIAIKGAMKKKTTHFRMQICQKSNYAMAIKKVGNCTWKPDALHVKTSNHENDAVHVKTLNQRIYALYVKTFNKGIDT